MSEAAAARIEGDRLLGGRYRLTRLVDGGGLAKIWEGHDEVLGRSVAIKTTSERATGSFSERFRSQAVAAARLAHPNVVGTYDAGNDGRTAYVVMELVDGRSLRQELAQRGTLPTGRAVDIAAKVAAALDHAHAHGVVHGGIRPSSILLCDDGGVKVADFGTVPTSVRTGEDEAIAYLAPEQLQGVSPDARADVYALGAVLYQMLCGRRPYPGRTADEVGRRQQEGPPLRPRQARAGIPRPLEQVVLRSIAPSPGDRYPTAGELETALRSIDLAPDDATAMVVRDRTPPEGLPRVTAPGGRSWLVAVVLVVVVAVVLGTVGVLFAGSDAGREILSPGGGRPSAVAISGVQAYDPEGSDGGHEHDGDASNATDGNPTTAWTTEQYRNNHFGGLKDGVGLVIRVQSARPLGHLEVTTPTPGWTAQVYVSDAPHATLGEWGAPVVTRQGVSGDTTLSLRRARGRAVLLWITDLGPGNSSVAVSEVKLAG